MTSLRETFLIQLVKPFEYHRSSSIKDVKSKLACNFLIHVVFVLIVKKANVTVAINLTVFKKKLNDNSRKGAIYTYTSDGISNSDISKW